MHGCHKEYTLTDRSARPSPCRAPSFGEAGMMARYCRVSSRSQKTDSQKAELTRWLTQQGHVLPTVQWFEDIERGQTVRRPALTRLQRAIEAVARARPKPSPSVLTRYVTRVSPSPKSPAP
jgi:hypothetical protein